MALVSGTINSFLYIFVIILTIARHNCDEAVVTNEVALDMSIGQRPVGRITIGLFGQVVPRTVGNFIALANSQVNISIRFILKDLICINDSSYSVKFYIKNSHITTF